MISARIKYVRDTGVLSDIYSAILAVTVLDMLTK